MKIKRIQIKPKNEFFADIEATASALDQGRKPRPLRGDYFESFDAVRKVLTPSRLMLWQVIRDRKPKSILELTKIVQRDFKAVHRDITVLVAAGVIELKPGKGQRGDVQKPVSLADTLMLEVA